MTDHRVAVEDADGVRMIRFDRPEARNAFDHAMYLAVTQALVDALADDAINAVVLTGAGSAFTAGQDLKEMVAIATGEAAPEAGQGFQQLLDILMRFDKPLLAAVNGVGMGLGLTLLLHCDLVLMGQSARLKAPFAEMGVPPEAGSSLLLAERMGWQHAALTLLASTWIDAAHAVETGLALRMCPDAEVVPETLNLARTIAAHPGYGTREIKRLMLASRGNSVVEARQREEEAFRELFADDERNPGNSLADGLGG